MTTDRVALSDIVQAYAEREAARKDWQLALKSDDRADIVGEDAARAARAGLVRASRRRTEAEGELERLLAMAYRHALKTREYD